MSTIQERGYVQKESRALSPTDLGLTVNDQLVKHFADVIDVGFTANMESKLDTIDEGAHNWQAVIRDFYEPFAKDLEEAFIKMERINTDEKTDEVCEKCGKPMVIKTSRFGRFMACTGYPECKNAKSIVKDLGINCPECGKKIAERRSRKGRNFFGCTGYPDCKFATWDKPTGEPCPQCNGFLVSKKPRGEQAFKKCVKCTYENHEQTETTAA
jgi:DNA topoisomerase-1